MKKDPRPGYFSFTRKERTGIIVIIFLVLLFSFLPFFYSYFLNTGPVSHSGFEKEISTLKLIPADSPSRYAEYGRDKGPYLHHGPSPARNQRSGMPAGELFYFDPNTLPASGWKKLGIPDRTIATLQHYLEKGGKFRKPEDIGKIWGLHEDEVQRLMPFVSIAAKQPETRPEPKIPVNLSYPRKDYGSTPVDINLADTLAFMALPGIGSRLASRIITFREKLGGFYKVDQVAETFALPDSTFLKIKPRLLLTPVPLKRINLNTASLDELKAHPYIRYTLANAIVQFRAAHGKFSAVSDIRKILVVTDEVYNKLEAYLVAE